MKPELDSSSKFNNLHWLEMVEMGSVIGSIGGTLISIVTQQFLFASVPLSLSVSLNLFNRRRLQDLVKEEHQTLISAISTWELKQQQDLEQLSQMLSEQEQSITQSFTQSLHQQQEQLTVEIELLKEFKENIAYVQSRTDSPEYYCQRAISLYKKGKQKDAIEDFSEAIHLDSQCADAYYHRGLILTELEDKKGAIENFRMAAKWYFQQGNIANYQQAKDMEDELYSVNSAALNSEVKRAKPVVLSNLFS